MNMEQMSHITDARELLSSWTEGSTHIIEASPIHHSNTNGSIIGITPGTQTVVVTTAGALPLDVKPKISRRSQTEAARGANAEPNALRPATTKAGKARIRMKWSSEVNQFIMRTYYTITNLETETKAYRDTLHRLFNQQYPDVNISQQRIADQRRAIVKNNLLTTATLEQIRAEVAQILQIKSYTPKLERQPTHQTITIKQEVIQNAVAQQQQQQHHTQTIQHHQQLVAQPHHIIIVETTNPNMKRHFIEEGSTI